MSKPARHITGKSAIDWMTMPSVVPMPSRATP